MRLISVAIALMLGCSSFAQVRLETGPARMTSRAFEDRVSPSTYQYDSGSASVGWHLTSGGEILGVHRFEAVGGADLIRSISCTWLNVANGQAARIFVWQAGEGGLIQNATLLAEQAVTVQQSGTGVFVVYELTKPVAVTGTFFVGFATNGTADEYPLPFELLEASQYVAGRAFVGTFVHDSVVGSMTDVADLGAPGYLLLRAEGSGSLFTYQGRLTSGGSGYTGNAEFRFAIYDSVEGGAAVSPKFAQAGVPVAGGVFSLQIPADPSWFRDAPDRYLEIEVRTRGDAETFSKLSPRQRIGQVPGAMAATTAMQALSAPWSGLTGVPANVNGAFSPWASANGGISYAGNVGFGTTTPTAPISFGNILGDLITLNGSAGGPNFGIGIQVSTLQIHTAVNSQNIVFGSGSSAAFVQSARIAGNGDFTIAGSAFKPGGGAWTALSDPRAKHNATPLKGTLDRLLTLRGYEYFYNEEYIKDGRGLAGRQIGLMADEVERVFPDWITRDETGLRMVSERATTALMVEALRDLRMEKDGQINALRKENEQLKARLDRLEALADCAMQAP